MTALDTAGRMVLTDTNARRSVISNRLTVGQGPLLREDQDPGATRTLGTDTDDRSWEDAGSFDPERFVGVDDYEAIAAFVPHGGADVATSHRCPGEKLAIAGLAASISAMSDPRVTILPAGLEVDERRMPTKPRSGGRVRAAGSGDARCPFHRA